MRQKIIPSIMAKNQKELNGDLNKLKNVVKELHLDVVDGKFAKNRAMNFDFRLKREFNYNVHLMVNRPETWINEHGKKVDTIIFHPEVIDDVDSLIRKIKKMKRKVGLALKPKTKVKEIKDYLGSLDYILVLTVHPGFYGSKFLSAPLKKIKQIKKINPKVKVIVDGGMNPKTIKKAAKAGADYFVSGSYTTKAEFPKMSIRNLLAAIK
jgi:ribulose-phosphate 3-epimerase